MLKILAIVLATVSVHQRTVAISATTTGISAADLADTPRSLTINMEEGYITNQLSLTLAVTPGTSLVAVVRCYESQNTDNWDEISFCTGAAAADCEPDVRTYTLANYTAVSGVYYIPSRWPITKKFVQCSVDDPADGDGTVTLTGARSWR